MKKLFLFLSFLVIYYGLLFAEDITIATYYPSPFGSYNELTANQMKIGAAYSAAGTPFEPNGLLVQGNTGIGTTTPVSRLVVQGTGATNTTSSLNVTNSAGTSSLHVRDDGFVGVGGPTGGALWDKLHVRGSENTADGLSAAIALQNNAPGGDTWHFRAGATGTNTSAGGLSIANAAGYAINIDKNRRVGIGTNTPVAALDVGDVWGGSSAGYLHVAGNVNPATPSQGAYLGWNALTGGTGETDFINQRGWGPGGFAFIESTTTGVRTPLMTLDTNGLRIRNSFQDKIIFDGPNASPNTIVWANDKGLRFWDPILGYPIMSITRAGSTGSVNINSVAVPLTFYETDTGSLWRMPLDAGFMRFDKNTGSGFSTYRTPIAMETGGYALVVYGNAYATGGSWLGSDLRLKRNIEPLNNSLDKLLKLRGVSFEWKKEEFEKNGFSEGRQVGIIAQEMEKQFPELVKTDNEGYKAIAYDKFTAVLLEAIKSQEVEIKELKTRLDKIDAAAKK